MRKLITRTAVVVGTMMAMTIPSTPAIGAVAPSATVPMSSVQTADCDGAEEKEWVESSGFLRRTIYYANCRDVTVAREAYVYDLVPNYLGCKSVPPNSTVSWSTGMFPVGWGIATC